MESLVGDLTSGVKAQVDPAANTETAIAQFTASKNLTIVELDIGYANVVDAKAMTGYIEVKFKTGKTPFRFPIGFGTGGAATLEQKKNWKFPVSIPVEMNDTVTVYATMNEATVGMFCGMKIRDGLSSLVTHGECNTAEDAAVTADTRENGTGTLEIPAGMGGRIKQILVAYANVVNAKAASGYIEVTSNSGKMGQQFYQVGGGSGGATNAGGSCAPEIIETDIPVKAGEKIQIYSYLAEAAVDLHIGIVWV
jgi:hypothetical protein